MRFAKGHGTGNDFVVLPDPDDRLELTAELVAALCDRRRGIGADGVLRVVRTAGDWFMDYRNADGSVAEICGNGVRVFARYLVCSGLAPAGRIPVLTRAGTVVAEVAGETITVELPLPRAYGVSTATVDSLTETRVVARRGRPRLPLVVSGTAVDCGNPHLVCRVPELSTLDLRRPPGVDAGYFPAGVNVEFFTGDRERVAMRVHERGSGETQSCGSGALAVASVALAENGAPATGTVTIDVPGGQLVATFAPDTCWLAGPAVLVADGTIHLGQLAVG